MASTEHTKRYRTGKYLVRVTWTSYETASPTIPAVTAISVNVIPAANPGGRSWSYCYTRSARRRALLRLASATVYWPISPPQALSRWEPKVGEDVARRFARDVLAGRETPGECGCKACAGVGFLPPADRTKVLGDVCGACGMSGYEPAKEAA